MVNMKGVFDESVGTILRNAIKSRNMTQTKLAAKLGILQTSLSGRLNRQNISLDTFVDILDALDYDVIIVDRESSEEIWRVESGTEK